MTLPVLYIGYDIGEIGFNVLQLDTEFLREVT